MKKKIILSVVILVLAAFCLSEANDRHRNRHHKDSVICMSWEDKTSSVYWETMVPEAWDGSAWVTCYEYPNSISLSPVGSWNVGYKPTHIRLYFTGSADWVDVQADDGGPSVRFLTPSSGDILEMSMSGPYTLIDYLSLYSSVGSVRLTKIEFLAPLLNGVYKFDTASYCGVLMSDISKIDGVDK